jgi:hypothetical protein
MHVFLIFEEVIQFLANNSSLCIQNDIQPIKVKKNDCKNHVSTMILYNNRYQRKNLTKIGTKTKTTRVESYVYKLKWINGPPCAGLCYTWLYIQSMYCIFVRISSNALLFIWLFQVQ